jgi:hypothetical protein
MQLHAVFVAPAELDTWSAEDALRRLGESEPHLKATFPPTDSLAEMLETVRIQLEADAAGSRFPLLWTIGLALTDRGVYSWDPAGLDGLIEELRAIETELERLPIGLAATVVLGDEGFPDVYFRVSPHLERADLHEPPNLGALMSPVLLAVRAVAMDALARQCAVALVRIGRPVEELWRWRVRN